MNPADLFTVRPDRFVAARNQLVKELKAAGEKDQATAVAAWRRPSPVDWILNVTAGDHEDEVASFLDAAEAARAAQAAAIEGRPGDDLRAAVGQLRDATVRVVRAAEDALAPDEDGDRPPAVQPAAITSRLAEVATSAELGSQLRERRLGSGGVEGQDLFAGFQPAPMRERTPKSKTAPKRAPTKAPAVDESPSKEALRAAEREAARALAAAERDHAAARKAADRAAGRVERAEAEVAAAEDRLAEAQAALTAARQEHETLEEAADDAARAVEQLRSG